MQDTHITVFEKKAIDHLAVEKNQFYLDATFGRGGHTREILSQGGKVIAFDWDQEAIKFGQTKFQKELKAQKLFLVRENFTKIQIVIEKLQQDHPIGEIHGCIFDFGTTSNQLKSKERGFSFEDTEESQEFELDMRMDQRLNVQAKDLLAVLPEKQLADIFYHFGGEKKSRQIAKAIVTRRKQGQIITTTQDLTDLITDIKKPKYLSHKKIHPATKVFQALRIAVNSELDNIEEALPQVYSILANNSRIVTIAFHQGEDRIVKHTFKDWSQQKMGDILTKKPIMPNQDEITSNPRARSAKMRVFKKEKNDK